MSRRILITERTYSYATKQLRRLSDAGFELVERYDLAPPASQEDLAIGLGGAWGVIAGGERYTREVLENADALRVIARPGAGHDAIDLDAANDAGILVFTTPGLNKDAVADFTVALMLAVLRQVVTRDREVRAGEWGTTPPTRDLYGAVVGIVGLGAIGRTVARRLSGFDCRMVGSDPAIEAQTAGEAGVELLPLTQTLAQAEIVTLHTPLIAETRGLIGAAELRAMRSDAVLINTSRGLVVQESALVNALTTGAIAAAALDVFEREPLDPADPLTALPNVLLSSHSASHSLNGIGAMIEGVADGILEIAAGGVPPTALNPHVLGVGPSPDVGRRPGVSCR
jgi:D-3-phosphoglycerate dehydrogenase / 2-oxoglutarate reductase